MKRPAAFIGGMAVIAVVFAINRYAAHDDPRPDARVLAQAADQRQHPAALPAPLRSRRFAQASTTYPSTSRTCPGSLQTSFAPS